jgi:TonB family protein
MVIAAPALLHKARLKQGTARLRFGRQNQMFCSAPVYHFNRRNLFAPNISIARLARIEGAVVVTFQVDAKGGVTDTQFESGHPMLRATVKNAVSEWKLPKEAADQQIKATIDFKTNCPLRLDDDE